jgi:hypothetical protein
MMWVALAFLLPLSGIWFSNIIGDYIGGGEAPITSRSPAVSISIVSWVILMLPIPFLWGVF